PRGPNSPNGGGINDGGIIIVSSVVINSEPEIYSMGKECVGRVGKRRTSTSQTPNNFQSKNNNSRIDEIVDPSNVEPEPILKSVGPTNPRIENVVPENANLKTIEGKEYVFIEGRSESRTKSKGVENIDEGT
ncbi:2644_t:CDS:2, partial [Racocetra persica]